MRCGPAYCAATGIAATTTTAAITPVMILVMACLPCFCWPCVVFRVRPSLALDARVVDHPVPAHDLRAHAIGQLLRLRRPDLDSAVEEAFGDLGLGERCLHLLRQ